METGTPGSDELEEMLGLEKKLTDRDLSLEKFRELFEEHPELYVVCRENGKIIGEASGELKDGKVLLESIAVRKQFRGENLGKKILREFLERSSKYSDVVSVASARGTEGFYESCGFEQEKVLLQVRRENLPNGWQEDDRVKNFRSEGGDDFFIYVNPEDYSGETLDALKEEFNAHSVNTILKRKI
ncbi:MAG: N-acetyltransferase family protein [Candidatus Nanosalina sp.]